MADHTPNKDDKCCFYCQEIGHFVDRCVQKAHNRHAAAEKNELRLLAEEPDGHGQDNPTEYNLTWPAIDSDPIFEDSDNEYTEQLNI